MPRMRGQIHGLAACCLSQVISIKNDEEKIWEKVKLVKLIFSPPGRTGRVRPQFYSG